MIMERLECTAETAFDVLRLKSQRSNRKLHDVAADHVRACTVSRRANRRQST